MAKICFGAIGKQSHISSNLLTFIRLHLFHWTYVSPSSTMCNNALAWFHGVCTLIFMKITIELIIIVIIVFLCACIMCACTRKVRIMGFYGCIIMRWLDCWTWAVLPLCYKEGEKSLSGATRLQKKDHGPNFIASQPPPSLKYIIFSFSFHHVEKARLDLSILYLTLLYFISLLNLIFSFVFYSRNNHSWGDWGT